MFQRPFRTCLAAGLVTLTFWLSGCATNHPVVKLPYEMPAMRTPVEAPAGRIASVVDIRDAREDRSLDMFLDEPPKAFVRKALAAELTAAGAMQAVSTENDSAAAIGIEADLNELSWAVPNHEKMMKTAFWTSFLTGGLGGLAYGSTDTPVYGHASIKLKLTERSTGRVLLDENFDALHEERTAKLKCDSLETRARVMAAALKAALVKATQAVARLQALPTPQG